jgi:hypothetical protein
VDCLEEFGNLQLITPPRIWPAGQQLRMQATIQVVEDIPAGDHDFLLCIQTGDFPPAIAAKPLKITILQTEK